MIEQNTIMRVARPTDNLDEISKMYQLGLGLNVMGQFEDHNGFDGVILGHSKYPYHLEFSHHKGKKVGGAPTSNNLLVFYIEDVSEWKKACGKMAYAGFIVVPSYNPYWDEAGKTFEDIDGYRVVLQNSAWEV
jgi:prolyl oligopeptidase